MGCLTFVGVVVEVDEIRLPIIGQSVDIHGVSVVLRCNVAAARGQIQSRDVVSSVAVLEFDSLGTRGQGKQLMAETNAENWNLGVVHHLSEVVDRLLTVGGITGSVGDEDAIEMMGHLVYRIVVWEDGDARTTADQTSQDVFLDTTVDHSHVGDGVGGRNVKGRLGADSSHQIDLFGIGEGLVFVLIIFLTDGQSRETGTLLSEIRDDSSCVDTGNGGHTFSSTPLTQTFDRGPV